MAFCNSCGATLGPGAKFCNKCGTPVASAGPSAPAPAPTAAQSYTPVNVPASTTPAAAPAPAPTGGSNALKIILIIVASIVGVCILAMVTCGIVFHRAIKSARVHQGGKDVKIETPFGNVEATQDPDKAVQELGIDVYPGAEVQKEGTSVATLGSIHTVTAMFQSSDSPDKVCAFYKSKFPNAVVSSADTSRCTVVSSDQKAMITINVDGSGSPTKIEISSVTKKT